jgi:hypothetical protein
MTQEALKLALELIDQAITDIKEALAQTQEPVAYDKTEMNCFVQDLYDKKMQEGKHGHYETMFHVVHQAIKKVPPQRTEQEPWCMKMNDCKTKCEDCPDEPPQRTWVDLTDEEVRKICVNEWGGYEQCRAIEARLKELNT